MLDAIAAQGAGEEQSLMLPKLDLDSFKEKGYLTHSLHPYPAKFVPQIPRAIMDEISPSGGTILDPFCGSGTTLVEASLSGRPSFGVDSNQLATRISRAKTHACSGEELVVLRDWRDTLAQVAFEYAAQPNTFPIEPKIPEFKNRAHWFREDAALELGMIRGFLDNQSTTEVLNIAEVVFSSIIVKCSRQESDTRWRAIDKPYVIGDALNYMLSRLTSAITALTEFSKITDRQAKVGVHCSDASDLSHIASESVDTIVTSPPYLNSFDYYLYHKLRMFWLGIDHYAAQKSEIGSRNKHCDNGESTESFYEAMRGCAQEMCRVLRSNGKAAIVVGDSIYQGELVRMDRVYTTIFGECGMRCIDHMKFNQRKYTRSFTPNLKTLEKSSHILLFEKD